MSDATSSSLMNSNELVLALGLVVGFAICWSVMFFALSGKTEILRIVFDGGNLLRMIAVVFVVVSVAYLSLVGQLTAEAAAIFSGIAGYVLGGITRLGSGSKGKGDDTEGSP